MTDNNRPGEVERYLTERETALVSMAHSAGFNAGYANRASDLPEGSDPSLQWFLRGTLSPLAALTQQEKTDAE